MNPINVDVFYRPVRIGWCLHSGNFEDYRKALMHTGMLWGGKYNPIIPIDNFDLARKLIRFFRVDLLLPISENPEIFKFIEKFNHISNPLLNNRLFDTLQNGAKISRFADISHPIFKLHEREYKNCSDPKCQILIFDWSGSSPQFSSGFKCKML
jgi:hypothetical protein